MTFSINPTAAKTQAMFQSMAIAQNGTGAGTGITGGAAPPAAGAGNATGGGAAAAPPASGGSAAGGSSVQPTMGQGTVQGGACVCAVTCASGSFPAAQAQGVGAFGGLPGKPYIPSPLQSILKVQPR